MVIAKYRSHIADMRAELHALQSPGVLSAAESTAHAD